MAAAHDELALYAVNALPEGDRLRFEAHLEACERCRRELACLLPVLDRLACLAGPAEPPQALRERILAAARSAPKIFL